MHSIHTSHNKPFDTILHILGPLTIVVPDGAIRIARYDTHVFQPLAALFK